MLTPRERSEIYDLSPDEIVSYYDFRRAGQSHADSLQSAMGEVAARHEVAELSDEERRSYHAFRRLNQTHADALQSARDTVAARNQLAARLGTLRA